MQALWAEACFCGFAAALEGVQRKANHQKRALSWKDKVQVDNGFGFEDYNSGLCIRRPTSLEDFARYV